MKIITVTGKGATGELQSFHIVNPVNIIITTGEGVRPGSLKNLDGNPVPIIETKTFIHVEGKPLIVEESIEEILEKFND